MSLSRIKFVTSLILVVATVAFAGDRKESGFSLDLLPSQNATQPGLAVWRVGTPVFVIVTMVNNSRHIVHYSLTDPAWDYEMDVRDSSGVAVPETEHLHKLKEQLKSGLITTRNILCTLRTHESAQDTIEVSYLYDLSRPGRYSVQVRRQFPEVSKKSITSDTLEFTVEP